MADQDYFNQLKGKVQELRKRRDDISLEVMQHRMQVSQLDEQIMQLQREKQRIQLDAETKDNQVKKYNTLIEQNEEILNKMIENSQRLSDKLSSTLDNNLQRPQKSPLSRARVCASVTAPKDSQFASRPIQMAEVAASCKDGRNTVSKVLRKQALTENDKTRLNSQIDAFVESVSPSQEIMDCIKVTYKYLKKIVQKSETIRRHLGGPVSLKIYGSAVNGLFDVQPAQLREMGLDMGSDLDLTLIVDEEAARSVNKYQTREEMLHTIMSKLKSKISAPDTSARCTIMKVGEPYSMSAGPLLEIECATTLSDGSKFTIDVDISINKSLEMLNSKLVYAYCGSDVRFHKVALVLKNWNRGLDSQKSSRLNSFSIYLLLLIYMLEHQYLVNLQAEAPRREIAQFKVHTSATTTTTLTTEVQFLKDQDQIDLVYKQKLIEGKVKGVYKTAAEILVGFLRFYRWSFISGAHVAYIGPRSEQYFYNIGDLEQVFDSSYVQKRGRNERYDFTVCDPFNKTYNPAKVVSAKRNKPFNHHFESALKKLLIEKKFIC